MQAEVLQLSFTSSTGNSEISIGGVKMTDNITLNHPIATNMTLEFTTGDVDMRIDCDEIVEIDTPMMTYRGFLKNVDFRFREEAVKYKIIISHINLNEW